MKTTAATLIAILATAAEASPLARRDVCNAAPSGSGNPTPLSKPTAATALACQQACTADSSCKCFVFGLPPNADAPTCILYAVAASQVPSQGEDLNIFDLGCPAAQIPTTAPTHDEPIGEVPAATGSNNNNGAQTGNTGSQTGNNNNGQPGAQLTPRATICNATPAGTGSQSPIASPVVTTALLCQQACSANSGCQSFVFGLPPAASVPECLLFAVPAAQCPSQGDDLKVFDVACASAQVPTTAPTHDEPVGEVPAATGSNNNNGAQTGNTGSQNGQTGTQNGNAGSQNGNNNNGQPGAQLTPRATICNATPAGTGSQSPIASPVVTTALLCQQACSANSGCQSFVFGLPPAASVPECLLFAVPAAQCPSQGDDLKVFDVACASTQVPTTAPTHDEPVGEVPATTSNNNNGAQTGNTGSQNGQTGTQNGQTGTQNGQTGTQNGQTGTQTGANNGAQGQH